MTNSIIDIDKFCRPLSSLIEVALFNQSFADLKSHLPDDITSSEDDMKEIINRHLVRLLQEQPLVHDAFVSGLTIVNNDMVIFFSEDMVTKCKELLMPIVEEYSKQRAKDIASGQSENVAHPSGSKKMKQQMQQSKPAGEQDLVPLLEVAKAVGDIYPELQQDHISCAEKTISWSVDGRNNYAGNDGPLIEFCRFALYSDELQRMCTRAVKIEVDRLIDIRSGMTVSSRSDGAAKAQNIGDSFESSFRTLCYLLQIFARTLDSIESKSEQNGVDVPIHKLKEELLLGCGSCLARLITEFCLFQHADEIESEGEGSGLFFESDSRVEVDIALNYLTTIHFPCFRLKYRPDKTGKPQSPLKYLQKVFPGSKGLSLSEIWDLCSDDCETHGASGKKEAGERLELFIATMQDICLQCVGIPFSKIDKKSEKSLLLARRNGILHRLENSQDREVVNCAVVLICHQVKNMQISGVNTINLALRILEQDKKIPGRVTETLRSLQNAGDDDYDLSGLIANVKKYGSAKNSKALAALVDDAE